MICNPVQMHVPVVRVEHTGPDRYRILVDGEQLHGEWDSDEVDLALTMCPVRVLHDCREEQA